MRLSAVLALVFCPLLFVAGWVGASPVGDSPEEEREAVLFHLEFRSVVVMDGLARFSLHDPDTGAGFWVAEGEVRDGVEVIEYRAEENILVLESGEEIVSLVMSPARIASAEAEAAPVAQAERRAEARQERIERFRAARATWEEAAAASPALRELEQDFSAVVNEFRDVRSARRSAPRDSAERNALRELERAAWREINQLAEYGAHHLVRHPAFADREPESLRRTMRGVMFSQNRRTR